MKPAVLIASILLVGLGLNFARHALQPSGLPMATRGMDRIAIALAGVGTALVGAGQIARVDAIAKVGLGTLFLGLAILLVVVGKVYLHTRGPRKGN